MVQDGMQCLEEPSILFRTARLYFDHSLIIFLFLPGNDNIFAAKRGGDTFCSAIRDKGAMIDISIREEKEASCLIICT